MKSRNPYLCNLKFLLLVLVVLGHSMEQVGLKGNVWYNLIYLFHMPFFAFLSGLFLKTERRCKAQGISTLKLYLIAQGVVVLFSLLIGQNQNLFTPFWHLWYLLSLVWWSLLGWAGLRLVRRFPRFGGMAVLAISGAAALLGGLLPLGRFLSLARTAAFFPYVWMGILCPAGQLERPSLHLRLKLAVLGLVWVAPLAAVWERLTPDLLYRADCYQVLGLNAGEGVLLRLLCFPVAVGMGVLVTALTPARRFPVTAMGGDTLPVYLLHAAAMPLLRLFWPVGMEGWLPLFAVGVVALLWLLCRWERPVYRVTAGV